jgi:hypothetical protein
MASFVFLLLNMVGCGDDVVLRPDAGPGPMEDGGAFDAGMVITRPDAGPPPPDGGTCPVDTDIGPATSAPSWELVMPPAMGCRGDVRECNLFNGFVLNEEMQYMILQLRNDGYLATRWFDRCIVRDPDGATRALECFAQNGESVTMRPAGMDRGTQPLVGTFAIYERNMSTNIASCRGGVCGPRAGCGTGECEFFAGFEVRPDRRMLLRHKEGLVIRWFSDCSADYGTACDVLTCRSPDGRSVTLRAGSGPEMGLETTNNEGMVFSGQWTLYSYGVEVRNSRTAAELPEECAAPSSTCNLFDKEDGFDLDLFTHYTPLQASGGSLAWFDCEVNHEAGENAFCDGFASRLEMHTHGDELLEVGPIAGDWSVLVEEVPSIVRCDDAGARHDLSGQLTGFEIGGVPGDETLTLDLEVESLCPVSVDVKLKPFLLVDDRGAGFDGIVLETSDLTAELRSGRVVSTSITSRLPPLSSSPLEYLAAVILDSTMVLTEADELNNVTQLLPIGEVHAEGRPFSTGYDLYTEIRGEVTSGDLGAEHSLRTIRRGTMDYPSELLFARYMAADTENRRVYTLPYDMVHVEKQFYALAWNSEVDWAGNPIGVDYYWQAPSYRHVPNGNYTFLTLIDSHDLIDEVNESNNLDVHPFTLSPLELVAYPNTWFVTTEGGPAPPSATVRIRNPEFTALGYSVSFPPGTSWLRVMPSTGTVGFGATVPLTVTVDPTGLIPGAYRAYMAIASPGYEAFPIVIPVYFFVHGDTAPTIAASPSSLSFEAGIDVHPPSQDITIVNDGDAPLEFEIKQTVEVLAATVDPAWLSVAPTDGVVPAGGSRVLRVLPHPDGLPRGTYRGTVNIHSNAAGPAPAIAITHTVR